MEVVERPWRTNVEQYADVLALIMSTARSDPPKAVRFPRGEGLPWTVQGLRNILARRGLRLITHEHWGGRDLWCEIIVVPPIEKIKRPSGRRIRLVERETR